MADLQEFAARFGNLQVSDTHLEDIPRSSCTDWRRLGYRLELGSIVVSDIERTFHTEEEKRYGFFREWKRRQGSGGTYEKLIRALLEIKCREDAEYVGGLLKARIGHTLPVESQQAQGVTSVPVLRNRRGRGAQATAHEGLIVYVVLRI